MGKHAEKLWGLATAVALVCTSAMVGCGRDEVNKPLPASQPASVTGRIAASGTGLPYRGIKVSIGTDTTVTDQDGRYCLPAPPHQQVTVRVIFAPPQPGDFYPAICSAPSGRVMTGDPGGCDHATRLDLTVVCTPI